MTTRRPRRFTGPYQAEGLSTPSLITPLIHTLPRIYAPTNPLLLLSADAPPPPRTHNTVVTVRFLTDESFTAANEMRPSSSSKHTQLPPSQAAAAPPHETIFDFYHFMTRERSVYLFLAHGKIYFYGRQTNTGHRKILKTTMCVCFFLRHRLLSLFADDGR